MAISDGIPAVPRNKNSRNSVPNPCAEEKTTRNSVSLNKNRSKLSEFPSERFSGREKNSEFCSVSQKNRIFLEFPSEPFRGREKNSEFRSEPYRGRENYSEQNAAAQILKIVSKRRPEVSKCVYMIQRYISIDIYMCTVILKGESCTWLFCLFCKIIFL
jgi:hypothetical protein